MKLEKETTTNSTSRPLSRDPDLLTNKYFHHLNSIKYIVTKSVCIENISVLTIIINLHKSYIYIHILTHLEEHVIVI